MAEKLHQCLAYDMRVTVSYISCGLESDARYGVGKFEEGGGFVFLEGGSRKGGGFGRTPRTPLVTGLIKYIIKFKKV